MWTRPSALFVAMTLTLCAAAWAQLQPQTGTDEQPAPQGVRLDVGLLLDTGELLPSEASSPGWSVQAAEGRRLVSLPVQVLPVDQRVELSQPPFSLRSGGRFICWRIPQADQDEDEFRILSQGDTTTEPPRLARKIALTPDGQIAWELDRALAVSPNAQPDANSLYAMKVRPDLLQAQMPQRPGADEAPRRRTGGSPGSSRRTERNDPEDLAERRAEEQAYREAIQSFNDLRDRVRDLPETFTQPAPSHVYAIFELPETVDELSLSGDPPLPWRIGLGELQNLSQLAGQRNIGTQAGMVFELSQLAGDGRPLTHRLVAAVLVRSETVAQAESGDALYRLIEQILAGSDHEARTILLRGLADTSQPTPATTALLQEAARTMPGDLRLIALQGLLGGDFANPQDAAAMLEVIHGALTDPDGPDAGQTLLQVAQGIGDTPQAVAALSAGVDFSRLEPQRLDQAIDAIVRSAPTQPLSAAWLDRGLLGADDQTIVTQTLERLAAAAATPHDEDEPETDGLILITGEQHHLIGLLQSDDSRVRDLAWQSLPAFAVDMEPAERSRVSRRQAPEQEQAPFDPQAAIDRIMQIALAQPATPPALAPFLSQQPHAGATRALVKLVAEGDEAASQQAATALIGSGREPAPAIEALEPADRAAFARRLYEHLEGEATRVVELMRYPEPQVAEWFGQQIAAGQLPQPAAWASSLDEQTLVRLTGSSDEELAAGAVAALVYAAGGDRIAVDQQVERVTAMTDRADAAMAEAWNNAKRQIFTRRLADAAGMYTLTLRVYSAAPGPSPDVQAPPGVDEPPPAITDAPATAASPTQTHRLGTVELIADGSTVSFRNATVTLSVPTNAFAIRINNAGELKNFPVDALQSLDLQSIDEPIDLLPGSDGSWKGSGQIRDEQSVEVVLQPADGS